MLSRLLWICLAGALGTGVRYLLGVWASERFGMAFPYGTLLVNVVGCFPIGAVLQTALSSASFSPTLRLTLTTGFLGGLTTYSAFAYETVALARAGSRSAALGNFALTTLACFVAVVLGILLAQLWIPAATSAPR
jgi:CrcB protein